MEKETNNQTALHEVSKNDLKSILINHSLWVSSGGKKGRPANLAGYNLRGVVLLGENLKKANLQGAYLYGAYLKNANLAQANLSGVNLRGANLRWVNLKGANLTEANLVRADLYESNLKEANLIGANLQTSFLTPPFGFALFYLRGVAPEEISTREIYRGALPFVALQVFVLIMIIAFPGLVNWLPHLAYS